MNPKPALYSTDMTEDHGELCVAQSSRTLVWAAFRLLES